MTDRSGGWWTIHENNERLGGDPLRRTRYTIDDLLNRYETLGGDTLPEDLTVKEVEENFYSNMYYNRQWDEKYDLLLRKPERIKLLTIRTTSKMVRKSFDSYLVDSSLDPHLISPRKLSSLSLPETIVLTDPQLYVLKNQETEFGYFLSPHNLRCPQKSMFH